MEKIGAYVDADRVTAEGEWRPGDPAIGQKATPLASGWFNMLQRELISVVESGGLTLDDTDDGQLLKTLNAMGLGTGQFQNYSSLRTYSTGEVVRGGDGQFYEFYDRDQVGTTQGVDPTNPANRPHVWMEWDGVRPGSTIEWRSETLPEGYIENDGAEVSRNDYRRIFAAMATTYGSGDGLTTFNLPDDRGQFKRGLDNDRGIDPLRVLGTEQGAYAGRNTFNVSVTVLASDPAGPNVSNDISVNGVSIGWDSTEQKAVPTEAGDTRPRNISTIYITKI